jgi:hypothetical protein
MFAKKPAIEGCRLPLIFDCVAFPKMLDVIRTATFNRQPAADIETSK